jgi:hypothetical protein
MLRFILVLLTALITATVQAQSTPEAALARAKAQESVADQKAESEVAAAIADAEKLTSRTKAVERLKQAQVALDTSILIGTAKREELAKRIAVKIEAFEGKALIVPPTDPKAAIVKHDARTAFDKARIETEDIAKGLRKASELIELGQHTEAAKTVAALTVKYPSNPAVLSLRGTNLNASNLAFWNKIQAEYAQAWVNDQQNLMATATPIAGDIKFPNPEKWKEITKLRREAGRLKLTPKEQGILESLNTVVSVLVKDRPFQEGLQEFSNQIKQEIHIDTKSLEDAGLDLNRRTNFTGSVSARTALRALLQPQGLTFVVKDEIIQVMTLERAERDALTTRSYDISDIVDTGGPFSNAVVWGPQLSYQQTMQNAEAMVSLMKETIDPRCWKDRGGFCTITFHLPTKSIVVRASTEVHAALGGAIVGK